MTTDLIERLKATKAKADGTQDDRDNYAAYVADRKANGWSDADVSEYREEVSRIMQDGTADEKLAARQFWSHKRTADTSAGINERIRARIAADRKEAA